ncbi:MAG: 3'(2'),5'-bisphosphate nucleotidase [Anaerolineales bacterium]|nr:3'(2'),5'-bisphosphate nucleotidase [Chloroflexota bacterium]MBL6980929.1 3'(2'),5'-bisphosphate nucleotidase [Anaerolineales bacterium]
MLNTNNPEIKFAIHAVRQASALVQQVQAEMVSPALTKDDRSPVTVADFAAQALIGNLLEKNFLSDALIGEEDSSVLQTPEERPTLERIADFVGRYTNGATPETVCQWIDRGSAESASRYWTLDPIDGTKGFLRGDQYAVAFALVEDGQVQVGVLGCPNLASLSLVVAARGQGAWVASLDEGKLLERLSVSERIDPAQARLLRSFESAHTNVSQIDVFADALGVAAEPVRMDSQAKYAVLAAGQGEIYLRLLSSSRLEYREKIWDQAAGSIVIEEAGGRVTDLDGKALDFTRGRTLADNRGICATNGYLHEAALKALKTIGA